MKQQLLLRVSMCFLLSSLFWLLAPLFSFFPCFLLPPVKLLPALGLAFVTPKSHEAVDVSVYRKDLGSHLVALAFRTSVDTDIHNYIQYIHIYIYMYTSFFKVTSICVLIS